MLGNRCVKGSSRKCCQLSVEGLMIIFKTKAIFCEKGISFSGESGFVLGILVLLFLEGGGQMWAGAKIVSQTL